jgi:hypothetical protein
MWEKQRQKEHLEELVEMGHKYGRLILMDSGGIPEDVSKENYEYVTDLSRKLRGADRADYAV